VMSILRHSCSPAAGDSQSAAASNHRGRRGLVYRPGKPGEEKPR